MILSYVRAHHGHDRLLPKTWLRELNKRARGKQHRAPSKAKPASYNPPRRIPSTKLFPVHPVKETAPPSYLLPTGSPFVFVASCAIEESDVDPQSLFANPQVPSLFRAGPFQHITPKQFGYDYPTYKIPEVAFLGRSNVGKSSLVNAIMRRKLAKSSKRPGMTQSVYFYGLMPNGTPEHPSNAIGYMVDLPGYGFAKAPDDDVNRWQQMTQEFLISRRDLGTLKRLFILIDARRGTSQFDRNIMGWFDEADMPYSVVITKSDCVGKPQIVRFANEVCMRYHSQFHSGYGSQGPVVHISSSNKNTGIHELMASVDAEFAGGVYQEVQEDDDSANS